MPLRRTGIPVLNAYQGPGSAGYRLARATRLAPRPGHARYLTAATWLQPGVDVLAVIAVGPAVEAAVLHRGHVIGNEVIAEFVALVDGDPQRAALRLEGGAVRIA